jgi:hypothetical protein
MDSEVISRLLKGIARDRAGEETKVRTERIPTIEITPSLLVEIEPVSQGETPDEVMKWAAICLGTFGLLRIGELLGSNRHTNRILLTSQIRFYVKPNSEQIAELLPRNTRIDRFELPDRFTISLGATKTDQFARSAPRPIAAKPAVRAMWRWIHLRRDIGATCPELFRYSNSPSLSYPDLISFLQDLLESTGRGRSKITGKAFRRGGASGLIGNNVNREDAAIAGGWKSLSMLDTYANKESKNRRAIQVSRDMAH